MNSDITEFGHAVEMGVQHQVAFGERPLPALSEHCCRSAGAHQVHLVVRLIL